MPGRINHVSVNAVNLSESVDFYTDIFGAEPIPTPNFGLPVQWLALGRTQLHLFEQLAEYRTIHHFGVTVDDIAPVYAAARRRDAFDWEGNGDRLIQLPGDVVQLYLRDPARNLVEADHHGVERMPEDLRRVLKPLWETHPQTEENMRSQLFVSQ
jgi:catechol 2,3-dioxygenase-like lactoylglutathione lyase family enzyme